MKPKIILVLILCLLIVSPVMATLEITGSGIIDTTTEYANDVYTFNYNGASDATAIHRLYVEAPIGTTIDFTLTYGDGSTVDGSCAYTNIGFFRQQSDITLGGISSTYTYTGAGEMGRFYVTGYAQNRTDTETIQGIIIFGGTYALSTIQDDYVFYPTDTNSDGVVYAVSLSANNAVNIELVTNPRDAIAQSITKTPLEQLEDSWNEWVDFATTIAYAVKDFAIAGFYWAVFLWENKFLIIALYIGLTAAIAFNKSKDVFTALKTFFRYQKSLYMFILDLWEKLVNIIAQFRSIFRL